MTRIRSRSAALMAIILLGTTSCWTMIEASFYMKDGCRMPTWAISEDKDVPEPYLVRMDAYIKKAGRFAEFEMESTGHTWSVTTKMLGSHPIILSNSKARSGRDTYEVIEWHGRKEVLRYDDSRSRIEFCLVDDPSIIAEVTRLRNSEG